MTRPASEAADQRIGADPQHDQQGVAPNRHTLDVFLAHYHRQGLSSRQVTVGELFHPPTLVVTQI